jgi:aspartate ammonia-lyase
VGRLGRVSGRALRLTDDLRYVMRSNLAKSVAYSALRNLALELIRIRNDLCLLSSGPNTGLAEIELPALQAGSSIMAGEINPGTAELATMVRSQAVGADMATEVAFHADTTKGEKKNDKILECRRCFFEQLFFAIDHGIDVCGG